MTRWERENCQTLFPPLLYRYFIYYYYLLVDIVVLNAFDFESPFTTYNKLLKIQWPEEVILLIALLVVEGATDAITDKPYILHKI